MIDRQTRFLKRPRSARGPVVQVQCDWSPSNFGGSGTTTQGTTSPSQAENAGSIPVARSLGSYRKCRYLVTRIRPWTRQFGSATRWAITDRVC